MEFVASYVIFEKVFLPIISCTYTLGIEVSIMLLCGEYERNTGYISSELKFASPIATTSMEVYFQWKWW